MGKQRKAICESIQEPGRILAMKHVWLILPVISSFGIAQQAAPRTWSNVTTLSFVASSGNSIGETIGFYNDFITKWYTTTLQVKSRVIRTEATYERRTAIGPSLEEAVVRESHSSSVTAENYFLNVRLDHRLKDKDRWYGFSGTSWEQNLPIGLDNRYTLTAGVGRILADKGKSNWRVDAGFGATREEPVIVPAGFQKDFATFNLASSFRHRFRENISYNADFSCTYNLRELEDSLAALKQGLTVTMTKGTALKVGLDMNHRNKPALISVRAYTADDPPVVLGSLALPAKKLDATATTSLVISF
jgi:putative salt-induced outer membrane protein YdiY